MATSNLSALSNVTGTLSSAGIGSGLNVESIVSQLMAIERRPLDSLEERAGKLKTTLSEVGKLQSNFSALRDKAQALSSLTLWKGTTASSADASSVSVSSSSGATAGSYAVKVERLASTQTLTSAALDSKDATLGAGRLTIELGRYADDGSFSAKSGSSAVSIEIPPEASTLAEVRDAINTSEAGVVAALVTDASGTRLSLRSKETGAENAFRVSVAETVDDGETAAGLSRLAYDAGGSSGMTRTATAVDAAATINGIAVSSASNTLGQVIEGLSFTLRKTTAADDSVDITVATDTEAVKKAVTDFVSTFNTLASYIRTATAYNAGTKTGGPLQGDQGVLSLQSQLRAAINQGNSNTSRWSTLSQIGITMGTDGTLSTNTGKLDDALGNLGELRKLLADSGDSTASTGFAKRFQQIGDAVLGSDGAITTRNQTLQRAVDNNTKSQESAEQRLNNTEARLRKQYQSLDSTMTKMRTTSGYVSSLFTSSS